MTLAEALRAGAERLAAAGIPGPERDARWLLQEATGLDAAGLSARAEQCLTAEGATRLEAMLDQRARHQPVAQIIGWREFWGRRFEVTRDTLDPRADTETLIDLALAAGPVARFIDLGTGTGCIAVTLLAEWPEAQAIATDVSAAALEVAGRNAERHGVGDRLTLVEADWFEGVDVTGAELILSNPPYIAADEMAGLEPSVRDWEPWLALTPEGDGLAAYRRIADAPSAIAASTRLLLEIGHQQADSVSSILKAAGWYNLAVHLDLSAKPRVISARFKVR